MIESRKRMLRASLDSLERPLAVWCEGDEAAAAHEDLGVLLSLHDGLTLNRLDAPKDLALPQGPRPAYGMSLEEEGKPRGNRFVGFPTGFSLDAFVDELVALSRGQSLSSPLARESLPALRHPVHATVLTSPG